MRKTVAIVGANVAGVSVAKGLRDLGFDGEVVLIDRDLSHPYQRPPLSKDFLFNLEAHPALLLSPAEASAKSIDLRVGQEVRSIANGPLSVALADGTKISPSTIVLCTGTSARRLAVPGGELPGVHYLRDHFDATVLRRDLHAAQTVGVIGGGLIGLELASTARSMGKAVTVIEQQGQLCPRILPASLALRLQMRHEAHGVEIALGREVRRIERNARRYAIHLDDETVQRCDVVLVGIGAVPNCGLAIDVGIECDNGILVDAEGRTSAADVYAAGDVARTATDPAGRRESFTDAAAAGLRVSRAIMKQPAQALPPPYFWSDQHGLMLQSVGDTAFEPEQVVIDEDQWCATWHRQETPTGAIAFGKSKEFALARRLIHRRHLLDNDTNTNHVPDNGAAPLV